MGPAPHKTLDCAARGRSQRVRYGLSGRLSLLPIIVCRPLPNHPRSQSQPEEEAAEFDMAWLGDFIDRLSEFDKEMNGLVAESGA